MLKTILLAGSLALAPLAANAIEIDWAVVLTDLDGQPIKEADRVLTLGRAAMMALTLQLPNDTSTGEEKFKRGQLASKVYTDKRVDISVEDIATIKGLIGKVFTPIIVMRAYPLLDPPKK